MTKSQTVFLVLAFWAAATMHSAAQVFTNLISFEGYNGRQPYAGLVQGRDGDLYGTTSAGGGDAVGEVFKITPTGTLHKLHGFEGADGGQPLGGLVLATDGRFYGTTSSGGLSNDGTLF